MLGRQLADVLERCNDMIADQKNRLDDMKDQVLGYKKGAQAVEKRVDEFLKQLRKQQDQVDRFKEDVKQELNQGQVKMGQTLD